MFHFLNGIKIHVLQNIQNRIMEVGNFDTCFSWEQNRYIVIASLIVFFLLSPVLNYHTVIIIKWLSSAFETIKIK